MAAVGDGIADREHVITAVVSETRWPRPYG
jgi:hypothetical protein